MNVFRMNRVLLVDELHLILLELPDGLFLQLECYVTVSDIVI